MDDRNVLNSWKEISTYIGRGVRTVQRWERDFGLPVRRPAGHMKSAVVAMRSDIDQWLSGRKMREMIGEPTRPRSSQELSRGEYLAAQIELMEKQLEALRAEHARYMAASRDRLVDPVRDEQSASGTAA